MTLYGDLDHVKRMLRPDDSTSFNAADDARLTLIQAAVSSTLEQRMGRKFGAPVVDTTHLLYAGRSSVVLLPVPARAITSVTVDGTLINAAWYVADPVDFATGLIWGLRLVSGSLWGWMDAFNRPTTPVSIVGDFTDSDNDAVIPDDVQYIANYLIAERYKVEGASPAGFTGPDGAVVPIRNAWIDPLVKAVVDKYGSQARAVVF